MSDTTQRGRPKGGFSRRDFLKGSGAAAAATALASGPGLAEAEEKAAKTAAPGRKTVTLNVNGKDHKVSIENRMTLLEVLRYQLNLTGAKPVSDDGSSGASTVLLDGKPVTASTKLAIQCVGKEIETVESLGGENPDAVPVAFVKHDGQQCGFCTPGFVVAVRAYLNENPGATEEEIRANLNSNLCRCGTYYDVLEAALDAAKK